MGRRNPPAAQRFSLPLRAFLAGQILCASGFSAALRSLAKDATRPSVLLTGSPTRPPAATLHTTKGDSHHDGPSALSPHRTAASPAQFRTSTQNVKVRIWPWPKRTSDNAPDYRVYAGNFELGAAWKKISQAKRPYLSVTLDDPSFPATLYARLVEGEDGTHDLIWSRDKSA